MAGELRRIEAVRIEKSERVFFGGSRNDLAELPLFSVILRSVHIFAPKIEHGPGHFGQCNSMS
ncbi:MAG: hypothetical protein VX588_02085 [Verrucomicrobiota bacterium]|nr:hypothetical protein [Verrucomicrobiota bacterium]